MPLGDSKFEALLSAADSLFARSDAMETGRWDSEFIESDHPRDKDGKFGSGGSGGPSLTSREKTEIDRYSGDEFLRINEALRAGNDDDPAVKHLDSAISKLPLPSGTKLYRGMTKDAARKLFNGNIKVGEKFSDKAFASTSSSSSMVEMIALGGVMLEIEVKAGAHGLDMSKMSRNESEKEVLLPRNAKMTILGIRQPKKPGAPIVVRASYE